MPTHDAPGHPLAAILATAFAPQLESGEVDLVVREAVQEFEVQADEWTLHVAGWPLRMAFIALDEEPSSLAARRAALDAALDNQHLAALRHANRLLDNAIASTLGDSGDEVSGLLAQLVAVNGEDLAAADDQGPAPDGIDGYGWDT